MADLTVIILTKNEESNIEKCIKSLNGIAERVVLIDSGSTDKTLEKAAKLGAESYFHEFSNHASQLNWGLENIDISTEWVMRMDADEELTRELAEEIENKLSVLDKKISGIFLRRRIYFMGRWIRHGGVYPTMILRIFRKNKAFCEQTDMDEHFVLKEGASATFKYDFIDNNTKSLEWWINKHNWYSGKEMSEYLSKKEKTFNDEVRPRLFGSQAERKRWFKYMFYYKTPLMRRAHWYFIYRYFFKLGFLDGKEGLIFHFLQGYWYRFLVDAKIYETEKNKI